MSVETESMIRREVPSCGNEGSLWLRRASTCGSVGAATCIKVPNIEEAERSSETEKSGRAARLDETMLESLGAGRGCAPSERA